MSCPQEPDAKRLWRRYSPRILGATATLLLVACGRPATEQECAEIVERIAALELAAANVPAQQAQAQVAETKQTFEPLAVDQCIGKRITDGALRCVRDAKSAQEIVDDCFN
jgi:hypothetical protein